MRKFKAEAALLAITALFLTFVAGFAMGSRSGETALTLPSGAEVVTERSAPAALPESSPEPDAWEKEAPDSGALDKLNLNTATKEDLMALPGIGDELADRILAYRARFGAFYSTDELLEISGIGEKKYRAVAGLITVS